MSISIEELSKEVLQKSPTYRKHQKAVSVCISCQEPTNPLTPCCKDLSFFEGSVVSADKLWAKIASEILEHTETGDHK